ncbi:hypothetical protein P7K49_040874, partial [Saguinus oedipus]
RRFWQPRGPPVNEIKAFFHTMGLCVCLRQRACGRKPLPIDVGAQQEDQEGQAVKGLFRTLCRLWGSSVPAQTGHYGGLGSIGGKRVKRKEISNPTPARGDDGEGEGGVQRGPLRRCSHFWAEKDETRMSR